MNAQLQYQIEQFFYRKSELCDAQDWDAYVQLFDPQSEFHLPQWDSEHVYTRDPKREMSLIYYANRSGLEDRVFRLRTGKAASATPMPRTLHLINNVRIAEQADGTLQVVLPDWQVPAMTIYALYPSRRHLSPAVRALLDFLVTWFATARWQHG